MLSLISVVISIVIGGVVVGGLARALIPGRQQISVVATAGLGIVGSILGGMVGAVLFGDGNARFFGLLLSVAAAAGLLALGVRHGWVRTAP